jgi:hypothetical protein
MTDSFDTVRAKKGFNWPRFHAHWHYPDWIVLLGVAALSDTNQSEVSDNYRSSRYNTDPFSECSYSLYQETLSPFQPLQERKANPQRQHSTR